MGRLITSREDKMTVTVSEYFRLKRIADLVEELIKEVGSRPTIIERAEEGDGEEK